MKKLEKVIDKKTLRVIDANFNRSKEGLRVIEDVFRFVLEEDVFRKKARKIRHSLDSITKGDILSKAILTRNSKKDLGKESDTLENSREDVNAILYANLQRVKESLRVLEEFFKLAVPRSVGDVKQLRYELYTFEKKILKKWPPIHNPR